MKRAEKKKNFCQCHTKMGRKYHFEDWGDPTPLDLPEELSFQAMSLSAIRDGFVASASEQTKRNRPSVS